MLNDSAFSVENFKDHPLCRISPLLLIGCDQAGTVADAVTADTISS
jgi:hypothetical protein